MIIGLCCVNRLCSSLLRIPASLRRVIAWTSCKQPVVALSTAESELIAFVESAQRSSSLKPLLDDFEQTEISFVSYTDNTAATSLVQLAGGPWRTRHLRIRGFWLRERLGDKWKMFHIPGSVLPAHIGTKTLSAALFWILVSYLDLGEVPGKLGGEKLDAPATPKLDMNKLKALIGALVLLQSVSPVQGESLPCAAEVRVQDSQLCFLGGLVFGIIIGVALGIVISYGYFCGFPHIHTLRLFRAFLVRSLQLDEEDMPSLEPLPEQQNSKQSR